MDALVVPFLNVILFFYHLLGNNLGWAIVAVTVVINLVLFPLNKKSMQMAKKQQALKPELDKLKKKYADNKQKLFEEQSKLMKGAGINPAAGCLPALLQLAIIIILIRAFTGVLNAENDVAAQLNSVAYHASLHIPEGEVVNTTFLIYDLTERDILTRVAGIPIPGLLVIVAAVIQYFAAKMMLPSIAKKKDAASSTQTNADDIAADLQKQMVYMFPLLYLWFGTQYPSGLALYFLLSSLFAVLRYRVVSDTVSTTRG